MKFDFGDNLKKLRNSKGLTQEQVAELLNVSKQSISRWENNITYPDISFLPILASFYCITVDSLLGADYESNKAILNEYNLKRNEAHHLGNMQDAFELSQKLYAQFPNEKSVINNIMSDSYLMGLHDIDGKKRHYLEMSIAIAERFLKMTSDIEEQCRCVSNIATCYKLLNQQEAAVSWAKKLPSMWCGIESTSIDIWEGQDKIDCIQCSLDAVLHLVHRLLFAYAEATERTTEKRIQILEKIPQIFEIMFENGDYGFYNLFLSRVYVEIAKLCTDDMVKSIEALKKSCKFAQNYDTLMAGKHTSLLFKNYGIVPKEFTKAHNDTQCERILNELYSDKFHGLQNTSAFKTIVKQLEPHETNL